MPEHPTPPLAELLKTRASLAKTLEENPIFQALQHVDNAIAVLRVTSQPAADKIPDLLLSGGLTPSQRDGIAAAAIAYFIYTNNAPVTVKQLCAALAECGIPLPEAAVSSVGGILGKRSAIFAKVSDATGYWRLTDAYYEEHKNSRPQG